MDDWFNTEEFIQREEEVEEQIRNEPDKEKRRAIKQAWNAEMRKLSAAADRARRKEETARREEAAMSPQEKRLKRRLAELKAHALYADLPEAAMSALYHWVMKHPYPLREAAWTAGLSVAAGSLAYNSYNEMSDRFETEAVYQNLMQALRAVAFGGDAKKYVADDMAIQAFKFFYYDQAKSFIDRKILKK